MLTDEEKKVAEQRALDRIREEQHTAEIKMYEQKIEDDARAKLRTEDAKDILLKMFWIAFGLSCVGFIAAKKTLRNSSLT